eukprot:2190994-Ditylum_brightwellii.AAC.1
MPLALQRTSYPGYSNGAVCDSAMAVLKIMEDTHLILMQSGILEIPVQTLYFEKQMPSNHYHYPLVSIKNVHQMIAMLFCEEGT